MLVENYRELLRVRDQLEEFYLQDIGLLHRVFYVQSKTIEKLKNELVARSSKRIAKRRYNLRELHSGPNIDENTFPEISKHVGQLSNKDSYKVLKMKELNEKRKKLENAVRELENQTTKTTNASTSASIVDVAAEQKVEENEFIQLIQSDFRCAICQEILIEAVLTNCSHIYCKRCLEEWVEVGPRPTCPMCRNTKIRSANAVPIDSFLNNCASLVPSSSVMQNWKRLRRETEVMDLGVKAKKRKLNSDHSGRRRHGSGSNTSSGTNTSQTHPSGLPNPAVILNLGLDLAGDDNMNVMLADLRNFTNNVNQSTFSVTGVVPTRCTSTLVVDLTEDDIDLTED